MPSITFSITHKDNPDEVLHNETISHDEDTKETVLAEADTILEDFKEGLSITTEEND